MTGISVAKNLTLPLDVAGETIAILAKRGAGKTNTATVLVEELGDRAEVSAGGTFSNYLRSLTRNGLAVESGGEICLSDTLFIGALA